MNSWISLNQGINKEEDLISSSHFNDYNDLLYYIEESYYNTLISIKENEIKSSKDIISNSLYIPITESTLLESFDSSIDNMYNGITGWSKNIINTVTNYFLTKNKDIEFQMKVLKKYSKNNIIGKSTIKCTVELLKDFKKLPFSDDFDRLFLNGINLKDEDVWLKDRDVKYTIFTRQFPDWLLWTMSPSKMKNILMQPATIVFRPMEYELNFAFNKLEQYIKDIKKEKNELKTQFSVIKNSSKRMKDDIKKARRRAIAIGLKSGKLEKKGIMSVILNQNYFNNLSKAYRLGYTTILTQIMVYMKAFISLYVEQFENVRKLINSMYTSLSIKDKRDIALDFDNPYYEMIKKDLRRLLS